MPVYEYRCRTCGHQFEAQQSFSEDPLTECPECEGELRKVFSPVGIAFKGTGFYKNDSRSGSSSGGSSSKESTSSAGGDSSGTGSSSSSGDSGSTGSSSEGSSSGSTSSPATTGSGGS